VLLGFGAPCQLRLLAGPEHGRTIPLAVIGRIEIPQCSVSGSSCGVLSFGATAREPDRQRLTSIQNI
jgi:hypothetical protein